MRVLGLETSTYSGSIAILKDDRIVGELFLDAGPVHSEKLLPLIDALLKEVNIDKKEVDGISLSIGPGSFTALRIGMATAKALSFSLKIPIVGVSSLEVLASNLIFTPFTICSIIDARKKEVFTAFFKASDGSLIRTSDERLVPAEALPGMVKDKTIFIGNGGMLYGDFLKNMLGDLCLLPPPYLNFPRAANCAHLGALKLIEGYQDDLLYLSPRYLRRADAEIFKER